MDYCNCELPIKVKRKSSDKQWYCYSCEKPVDPKSKAIDKNIHKCTITNPTRNEVILQGKINEIIDLLKSQGIILGER